MRVLLVYPQVLNHPNHPMGLLYIAAVLEKDGHEVKVLDPRVNYNYEKFLNDVLEFNPEVVGFTCTTPQVNLAYELARGIRTVSKAKIIFGGVHPTVLPYEVIKQDFVDIVIVGEGEMPMQQICNDNPLDMIKGLVYKNGSEVLTTGKGDLVNDLDSLPFPSRKLLSNKWYFAPPQLRGVWTRSTATIMGSRGCPYMCTYCSSHLVFGRKVRWRSTDNVLAELESLRSEFDIDSVWFADDTFTVDKKWVKDLCEKIIAKDWKDFIWCCQLRVDTIDEDTLRIMKKAGCVQVDIGVESGSPKILKLLKKGTTIELIKKAFALCKKVGVQSFASMIVGIPGETMEDIKLTEKLIKEIKPDFTEYFFATPYPGTELYDIAIKEKLLDLDKPYAEWIASKQTDHPTMKSKNFTEEELIKIRSKLHNQVIFRNYLTMFKRPSFIWGASKLAMKGIKGLPNGIKRFFQTGKLDNILLGMLDEARRYDQ